MKQTSPKALLFDVFGTVVDWRSGIAAVAEQVFSAKQINFDPFEFASLWRAEYDPAMERIRSGGRGYIALDRLHRENLDRVLKKSSLEKYFADNERDQLNHAWEQLPPWPDSLSALELLKPHFILAPCSNGSIALMTRLAKFAHLPWDCILGAEIAQDYKPKADVYLASCKALQLDPQDVVMVAAHNGDLFAARKAGLKTAFFPRKSEYGSTQKADLEAQSDWDFVSADMHKLAKLLLNSFINTHN